MVDPSGCGGNSRRMPSPPRPFLLGAALAFTAASGLPSQAIAGPRTIANATLSISCDEATGEFSATARGASQPFLIGGKVEGTADQVKVTSAQDEVFGKGQRIRIRQTDG